MYNSRAAPRAGLCSGSQASVYWRMHKGFESLAREKGKCCAPRMISIVHTPIGAGHAQGKALHLRSMDPLFLILI